VGPDRNIDQTIWAKDALPPEEDIRRRPIADALHPLSKAYERPEIISAKYRIQYPRHYLGVGRYARPQGLMVSSNA
jgi:hypothetical protein